MTYSFRPAQRDGIGVFGCIAGTSRSGKTLTALRIARGIAGPEGKIAAIDTEGGRMRYYCAPVDEPEIHGVGGVFKYHFDVFDMQSPFDPTRFCDAAAEAEAQGYACLVTDSFSLEWSGVGGVLDRYNRRFREMGSQQKNSDICWSFAKEPHKQMRDKLLQSRMPIIFCIRCNQVSKHLAGGREGTWKMEQDARFIYEWTFALTMHPATPGMPRYDLLTPTGETAWKMPGEFRPWFPEGQPITEAAGARIQAWRMGKEAAKAGGRRTVREIVRDRCLSAGDEADVAAIEALPAVAKALIDAPDDVKQEIRAMLNQARARIAAAVAEARGAADGGEDHVDPDEATADEIIKSIEALHTKAAIEATASGETIGPQMLAWKKDNPALFERVDGAIAARIRAVSGEKVGELL